MANKRLPFQTSAIFLFILITLIGNLHAQETIKSVGSGDWRSTSTWTPARLPADDDIILIESGHTVEISGDDITLDNVQMVIQGELHMDNSGLSVPSISFTGSNSGIYLDGGEITEGLSTSIGEGLTQISIGGIVVWNACSSLACVIVTNAFLIPDAEQNGDVTGTFGMPSSFINPLPIELVSFIGEFLDGNANLTWKTASELNNSGFELQRSWDGRDFETLTFIEGKGSSDRLNTYTYVDHNIMGIAYYRLKQLDYNGKFAFSNVISVKSIKVKPLEVLAYPNPFTNELNLAISKDTDEPIEIMVYDHMGNHVMSITEKEKGGNFVKNIGHKFQHLPAGYYYANIIVGKEMERIKLLKNGALILDSRN
ncbi:MAG: T9SS type A sorting domain-containing protein [Flammeovirgaceae bacterium]|nr:T9SS type A sorting domain-containing protein [Flammeovirgaceae bacterium]